MANEQRVDTLYGVVWGRATPDVARVDTLYGIVWSRPTPDVARVDTLYGVVWSRVYRTWDDIPGATKIHVPGGLTDTDEKGYFRARFTIGTGKITGCTLQVVAEERVRISLNGEDRVVADYVPGEEHSQITAYEIPPGKLVIGENLLAFEVTPQAGRLQIMLEFKLSVY
jgi:hypothetical protein